MNRGTGNVRQSLIIGVTEWLFTVFVGYRSEGVIFYIRFLVLLPLLLYLFIIGVQAAFD
ncbi:MAG: hypothetical protein H6632_04535 [Anaerolineales bacterium]|nr:hypothetical protein [Anaerolineales bacterium]